MKDAKKIIALGVVVTLVPFLGFPSSWKSVIFAVLGLAIAGLSYRILTSTRDTEPEEKRETYTKSAIPSAEPMVAHE